MVVTCIRGLPCSGQANFRNSVSGIWTSLNQNRRLLAEYPVSLTMTLYWDSRLPMGMDPRNTPNAVARVYKFLAVLLVLSRATLMNLLVLSIVNSMVVPFNVVCGGSINFTEVEEAVVALLLVVSLHLWRIAALGAAYGVIGSAPHDVHELPGGYKAAVVEVDPLWDSSLGRVDHHRLDPDVCAAGVVVSEAHNSSSGTSHNILDDLSELEFAIHYTLVECGLLRSGAAPLASCRLLNAAPGSRVSSFGVTTHSLGEVCWC